MATKQKEILRLPGTKQFQAFIEANHKLLNFTEIERQCRFGSGTLRYICAGTRAMTDDQYRTIQKVILPKMCEFVFLLQNYEVGEGGENIVF